MTTTIFEGGTIWRGAGEPAASAVLVHEGLVIALDDAARQAADGESHVERIDLDDGFLMPSFGDGHAHPIFGGLESAGPDVRSCTTIDEIIDEVRAYAEAHPDDEWIFGASYDGSLVDGGLFDARWLDQAVADRPVVLRAWDYHTVWVNSKALELAGIDERTPDPVLGEIPRRPDGSVLGILREWGAVDLVTAVAPERPVDDRIRALERAGDYFLARGVTWVQDAWVEPADIEMYLEAARTDRLPLRINLAFYADPRHFANQLAEFVAARDAVARADSPRLTANTVKFFADGVVENETGALIEPYCSTMHSHGMRVWQDESLDDAIIAVDAAGFQVHVHAIGDAAVRQALDAIERAIAANGPRDRRPVIAHAQLVAEADLERFAELGVIACMQPLWAQLDALMTVLTLPRLGRERADQQYRMRSLAASGAVVSFGSDWPCSSGDPLDGLAIAASRRTSDGEPAEGWTPHEIVPLADALDAYSSAVAHQAFADRSDAPWGRIAPGAAADLVWLEHDPRAVDPSELPEIGVRATYLAGQRVHGAATVTRPH